MSLNYSILSATIIGTLQAAICSDSYECQYQVFSSESASCNGYLSCQYANITAIGYTVDLNGFAAASHSNIIATSVDSSGYLAFLETNLYTTTVRVWGRRAGQSATIQALPNAPCLNVDLLGPQSGWALDIFCSFGEKCNITCACDGCQETRFYCYSGATCYYHCHNADNCPTLIGGVGSGLSDAQIYDIYLKNVEDRKHKFNDYIP